MANSDKPTRSPAPVIKPLKGVGLPEMRLKPEHLSDDDIAHLSRKSAWTLEEAAWALCGYRVPDVRISSLTDLPREVRQVVECMSAARITKDLTPIGPPDLNGQRKYLNRDEVIKWAGDRFPTFPSVLSSLAVPVAVGIGERDQQKPKPPARAVPMSKQHAETVLDIIEAAKYDPLALPPLKKGKPWVRAEITRECVPKLMTPSQFDRAWRLLRSDKRIKSTTD